MDFSRVGVGVLNLKRDFSLLGVGILNGGGDYEWCGVGRPNYFYPYAIHKIGCTKELSHWI